MQPFGDTRTQPVPVYDDRDEREARWTIRLLAVALFVAVLSVTIFVSLSVIHGDDAPQSAEGPPPVVETVTTLPAPTQVGPSPGTEIPGYVTARKAALAAAREERVAVVSLSKYSTQAQAKALMGTLPVVALLVAPPGIAPAVVTGDLAAWSKSQTDATTAEREEIKKLIPTVTDPAFKKFYNDEVARLDKALRNFSPTSALVFGVVVQGQAAALQAMGAKAGVRLVDVAENAAPGPNAVFRGLRPEEAAKADDPPLRPA